MKLPYGTESPVAVHAMSGSMYAETSSSEDLYEIRSQRCIQQADATKSLHWPNRLSLSADLAIYEVDEVLLGDITCRTIVRARANDLCISLDDVMRCHA